MKKLFTLCCLCAVFAVCISGGIFTAFSVEAENVTSAESAVLMERTTGRVLYAKDEHKRLPMASTTKIMTALTVIENCDLNETVCVDKRAVGVEGSSIYLREGEHLSVKELLYGLLLQSGNDSAVALAIHISGGVAEFAALMNKTAEKLALKDSNFTNPHGLHDPNHFTTAYDLGVIACTALGNAEIREIVATKSIKISNEGYEYKRVINNKNKLLKNYEYADGVKTGYTKKAGRCFVGSATKDGMQLVAVVLNCGPMFEDCQSMIEKAFTQYTLVNIFPQNKLCGALYKKIGRPVYFYLKEAFTYPLSESEKSLITKKINIPDDDDGIGTAEVFLGKQLIFSQKLVTI